jgi:hypothetical protein
MGQLQYKFTKCWAGTVWTKTTFTMQTVFQSLFLLLHDPSSPMIHFRLVISLTWGSQTQQWLPLSSKALQCMVQSSSPAAHANGKSPSLAEDLKKHRADSHYDVQLQKRLGVSSSNPILQQKIIGKLALSCPNHNRIRKDKLRLNKNSLFLVRCYRLGIHTGVLRLWIFHTIHQ